MNLKIGNFEFTNESRTFVVAELSANHNHDFDIAVQTIIAAKNAGADAVKLQTYTPDTLTINCDNEYFKIKSGSLWDGKTLYQLYSEAFTPWEWHQKLKDVAIENGLEFFSSPFDFSSVDFLDKLGVPAFKIASFEIFDIPLIKYAASKKRPIILSTGMASKQDIKEAVDACKSVGNTEIILLKCTSAYPAKFSDANLMTITDLSQSFGTVVGLSDHTIGATAPILSIAFGAKVIEKHFIIDRNIGGPDSSFSMNPEEFKDMVTQIRNAELAIGQISYNLSDQVSKNRQFARSLFIVENVKAGDILTNENVRSIRPGYGISPKYLDEILGKKFTIDIQRGTPLSFDHIKK